jgi:tRNA(His) 5'-end guanylyltransferase
VFFKTSRYFFKKGTTMSKDGTSIGARMKIYESHTNQRLMKLIPIYARVDGICFHTFCKGLQKPFDEHLSDLMIDLTMDLAKEFNANCAYTQSDEISFAWNLEDYESEMFCDGRVLKFTSHLASKTSVKFNKMLFNYLPQKSNMEPCFDARIMNLPNITEAANMFLWRELDATRNSVQMAGQAHFSHKQLHGKKGSEIQEMLWQEKKINWNDYPPAFKRGTFIIRRMVMKPPYVSKIPEQFKSKTPQVPVERREFFKYDMPPFTKVANRERVLFFGEEPLTVS